MGQEERRQNVYCPEHTTLCQTVGKIDGKLDILLDGQKEFKGHIKDIYEKIGNNKVDAAVEKTKTTPIFWTLMIVGAIVLSTLVTNAIHFFFPTAVVTQQTETKK